LEKSKEIVWRMAVINAGKAKRGAQRLSGPNLRGAAVELFVWSE
jgi:hypothetical protein